MLTKITFGLLVSVMLILSGCNTIRGVGQDVQTGGEKIENSADKAQKN
ncbi:entericidin [Methylovorus sp. MM2]|nr:entericidin A/B family lipoprotein [Methylovorus sp. MM2]OAM52042.1 entericidin [Methylovorus sp. MM2]